jgi:glycine dehydrogenase
MNTNSFEFRHLGPDDVEIKQMLNELGVASLDALIDETVPQNIRLKQGLKIPDAVNEYEFLKILKQTASLNKVFKSYIGLGYYNTITPAVILRNILENPGWYTAYTPYQAEIAQGRLEALFNFQSMVTDLSGMEIANASLLDEATASAEAMHMFFEGRSKSQIEAGALKFFVSKDCFPQSIDVLITRAAPLNIEIVVGDPALQGFDSSFFGVLLQYPSADGQIMDYRELASRLQKLDIQLAVAADLMSLILLSPPGEWGADVVLGSTQRFGVPMGYGGPHAAYFAVKEKYKRQIPGRIIGKSVDVHGNPAYRMALQTREQHIRRDKATSNICTSQVLLAVMAGMYAVYHGKDGLKNIAEQIHHLARTLTFGIEQLGFKQVNTAYFDTIQIDTDGKQEQIKKAALDSGINFRYKADGNIVISLDETVSFQDIEQIIEIFSLNGKTNSVLLANTFKDKGALSPFIPLTMTRKSSFLDYPVFNSHHSETEMLRYIKWLENKDLSLVHSMIPLGSCTMKLNATTEMIPLSWQEFSSLHPFAPEDQALGYKVIFDELSSYLSEITGFAGVSLQPNSGAQGEYAGLLVIRNYHISRNESGRNVVLIPASAHGTNPASAVMAGMKVVVVKCDASGNIDAADLKQKAELYRDTLSALMITYPSTHGVYEDGVMNITRIIHENGGQVYMDGANMNAQVGLTNPATIGADVCHLNLHKTFAIPHGGGGPGMGPIGVAGHLVPFLPSHTILGSLPANAVSSAPWGSASILLISYAYIRLLGNQGVGKASKIAILNANYLKTRLEKNYKILYQGNKNRVAHELILDCRQFKAQAGIEVEDIAKRLMDFGYHAPTVSFPVPGTLMIEPTESEAKTELDRFCEAMETIRMEIEEIYTGQADKHDNVLLNAPHTMGEALSDQWKHSYSREKAVFPAAWSKANKFWPTVGRIDNAYGDRNLICSCSSVESYEAVKSI